METYGFTKKSKFARMTPTCQLVTGFFSRFCDSLLFFQRTESNSVRGGSGWNMDEAEAAKLQPIVDLPQYHLPAGLT